MPDNIEIQTTNAPLTVVEEKTTVVVQIPGEPGPVGPVGPKGPSGTSIIKYEASNLVDGANMSFPTPSVFVAGTANVYLNGLLQEDGPDYVEGVARNVVEMLEAPLVGDRLTVIYVEDS